MRLEEGIALYRLYRVGSFAGVLSGGIKPPAGMECPANLRGTSSI